MQQFGMIGLGTMGRNLAYNIAGHGFTVCGYDRDEAQRKRFLNETPDKNITAATGLQEFVDSLDSPRKIMLLVPAGTVVDLVLADLIPLLEKGDIVIDGGNSHFTDTDRRYAQLQNSGIHFMGMGVSGGEEGARTGPSMMPGSNLESYGAVKDILEAIAAKTESGSCVSFIGNGSAGHYTKMVHNGIEYAMMQQISEIYGLLKNVVGLTNTELHQVFINWNEGELKSFLLEITAKIFLQKDDQSGADLIDCILDTAKQKGTGMWTSESALELNIPVPTIDVSVSMRYLSAAKKDRLQAAALLPALTVNATIAREEWITACCKGLHLGMLLSYAQGLHLLKTASNNYAYDISIAEVVRIWKGGCIIRSALLNDLYPAYKNDIGLENILQSAACSGIIKECRNSLKKIVMLGLDQNIPVAALSASLNYLNAFTCPNLPSNLIQAQRDYFGAHTYERNDREGVYHTNWE
jgi:6-phosphogluconate dehydrogenase